MNKNIVRLSRFGRDAISGMVVFLIAVPLCLGIALASNAPLFSGLLAGIIGGLVVGIASGSQTCLVLVMSPYTSREWSWRSPHHLEPF